MQLGLGYDEVRLASYTPEWKEEFIKVKNELMKHTNLEDNRIEHIGSTAIKGMSAKPIIDIIVGVDDLQIVDKPLMKKFYEAGFLKLKVERPGEIVLAKFTDDTYKEKTHFIHLVDYQKELWKNLVFFRDYLNSNEAARERYLEIKREYLKDSSTGVNEYTDFKEEFVKEIFKKRTD
ncbi:GrpB family protein [Allobacillus sp. GCM10007491]|uniref:GrpB family protein n=1 Tax=Allobacillus saliphilus TaxID=2912308 RepID=A0A941CWE5_9BACI|nr:GrpB family protein [Allobacillus saliphilus]MBR7553638.1 GrpB family protein [Allobacillus saliphilus]